MTWLPRNIGIGSLLVVLAFAFTLVTGDQAGAVGGEGESWPSFNESDGCGSPWAIGPNVERKGSLPSSTVLRGPQASYFGRTIGQVFDSLRWWDVPGSNDESLRLHTRIFSALTKVEATLDDEALRGRTYSIVDTYTFGYTARTVGGRYRVSQHGFGNAVDINSNLNPYRTDELITNMPDWFVDAWSDAGFCWGGNWISIKDPMHFNWRGPSATPGFTDLPVAYPPLTATEGFTRTMHTDTVPGSLSETRFRLLMDGDNDSAIDVVNISDRGSGAVIDVIGGRSGYRSCGVSRYLSPRQARGSAAIAGDWDRDGSQDLWLIDDSDGLSISAYLRFADFAETETLAIAAEPGDVYLSADHDVDGWSDLYILESNGAEWTVEVRSGEDRFETVLATAAFSADPSTSFTAIDRDLDQVPDLVGAFASGSFILDGASGFSMRESIPGVAYTIDDIAGTDFDGDGRHDLVVLSGNNLHVYAGNDELAGLDVTSWFESPDYECSNLALTYPYAGTFRDDDFSVHEHNVDVIAALGITRGCNPPLNDRFCPQRTITRGELAAFVNRALELPHSDTDTFVDDEDSIFEADIENLVGSGIVLACNAEGDRFCPREIVTREVMAQFLVAAFGFDDSAVDAFTDDEGSPHERDINAIAAVRVTRGCNPPENDRFCPSRNVSRAEMASFMVRALAMVNG